MKGSDSVQQWRECWHLCCCEVKSLAHAQPKHINSEIEVKLLNIRFIKCIGETDNFIKHSHLYSHAHTLH